MEQKGEQELLSIEGMIEKIIYQNEENGYTVCELLAPSEEYFVLVGSMPYLCEGESISALGNWRCIRALADSSRWSIMKNNSPPRRI